MEDMRAVLLKSALLRKGSLEIELSGRCMEPLLCAGDKAFVAPVATLELGDLVLVPLASGQVALHRIVFIKGDTLVTKGDYSGKAERLDVGDVIGVAATFSLDGGPWVDDPRTRRELADLAALSASICGKGVGNEARKLIWGENARVRKKMLSDR